jgi:hypothetical protein
MPSYITFYLIYKNFKYTPKYFVNFILNFVDLYQIFEKNLFVFFNFL